MKKIFVIIIMVLFSTPSFAAVWCMWSGTKGEYCQSDDNRNYVRMPDGHLVGGGEDNYNYHGFFERIDTQPVLGENQVRDQEVWDFVDNKIRLTWTIRDMTITEIDIRSAGPMPLSEYYLWKALLVKGVITQQEAQAILPQELIDAYLARDRLENP